jgi:hypothetical protein
VSHEACCCMSRALSTTKCKLVGYENKEFVGLSGVLMLCCIFEDFFETLCGFISYLIMIMVFLINITVFQNNRSFSLFKQTALCLLCYLWVQSSSGIFGCKNLEFRFWLLYDKNIL